MENFTKQITKNEHARWRCGNVETNLTHKKKVKQHRDQHHEHQELRQHKRQNPHSPT